jgi:hypothetical protein
MADRVGAIARSPLHINGTGIHPYYRL